VLVAAFFAMSYRRLLHDRHLRGGTAFAADQLGWKDWRQIIPWGSLDAGAIDVLPVRDPRRHA
jgi:hypothetical protein